MQADSQSLFTYKVVSSAVHTLPETEVKLLWFILHHDAHVLNEGNKSTLLILTMGTTTLLARPDSTPAWCHSQLPELQSFEKK